MVSTLKNGNNGDAKSQGKLPASFQVVFFPRQVNKQGREERRNKRKRREETTYVGERRRLLEKGKEECMGGKERSSGTWLDSSFCPALAGAGETFGHWKVWPKMWHSMTHLEFSQFGLVNRGRKEKTKGVSASPGSASSSCQQFGWLEPCPSSSLTLQSLSPCKCIKN